MMENRTATFDQNIPVGNGDIELSFNGPDKEIEPWLKCEPVFLVASNADVIRTSNDSLGKV